MRSPIPETIPRGALVTGGQQPAGLAIAYALSSRGFAVAIQCHQAVEAELPPGAIMLLADLSDEVQTSTLLNRAAAALGPIGVLVNGASAIQRDAWDEATRTTWDMHIETNLRAPFVLIQQFAKALQPPHEGVVINLLDQKISPHLVSYTLSKAALWTLTQTMALALAPRIRVNGIAPGPAIGSAPRVVRGRDPEDIAQAALAILALQSMTGQMIVPDGVPRPEV